MSIITITDSAKNHFKELMKNNGIEAFTFGVKSGGCSGFSYSLSDISKSDIAPDDEVVVFDDVTIAVDKTSVMFVLGTEIDWVTDMMGSRFEFINPVSQNSCGCGSSFSV